MSIPIARMRLDLERLLMDPQFGHPVGGLARYPESVGSGRRESFTSASADALMNRAQDDTTAPQVYGQMTFALRCGEHSKRESLPPQGRDGGLRTLPHHMEEFIKSLGTCL